MCRLGFFSRQEHRVDDCNMCAGESFASLCVTVVHVASLSNVTEVASDDVCTAWSIVPIAFRLESWSSMGSPPVTIWTVRGLSAYQESGVSGFMVI